MAESVVVGVRVRPFNAREEALEATNCIEMNGPKTVIRDSSGVAKDFTFDESFWSHDGFEADAAGYSRAIPGSEYADQRRVFDVFGKRVLDNAWDGFHCCLFAYGQTGSGKSYSMVGYGANKGIVPISCEEIFLRIDKNPVPNKRFEVTVSMVEIYNEAVQDLLILLEDRPKKGLEIRESKHLGIYIDGVTKRPVDSYASIEATIEEATAHRTVGATLMNATSSRAHTVQCIEFKQIENVGGKDQMKISMINLVDLAGSEKAGQTGATGDRLKEGSAINKSLSALGNVIEKLAEKSGNPKKTVLIPYRDSKLTRLLQNALGGSSKTIMVCALSPASSNYEETLSTLRYADRAKKIKNTVKVNEDPQARLLRELKEENDKLKVMMQTMHDEIEGGVKCTTQELDAMRGEQDEIAEIEAALKEYQKSFDQKLEEAKVQIEEQHVKEFKRSSLLQTTAKDNSPMLINLNADPQLAGKMKYKIEDGKTIRIGKTAHTHAEESGNESDSSEEDAPEDIPEVLLAHRTVLENHATVVNTDRECVLRSEGQCMKAAQATFLNGTSVAELLDTKKAHPNVGVQLAHGDRIIFGQCCFFFCDPQRGVPEVMIMTGQVDYDKSLSEVEEAHAASTNKDSKYIEHTRQVMKGILNIGSSDEATILRTQLEDAVSLLEAKQTEIESLQTELEAAKAAKATDAEAETSNGEAGKESIEELRHTLAHLVAQHAIKMQQERLSSKAHISAVTKQTTQEMAGLVAGHAIARQLAKQDTAQQVRQVQELQTVQAAPQEAVPACFSINILPPATASQAAILSLSNNDPGQLRNEIVRLLAQQAIVKSITGTIMRQRAPMASAAPEASAAELRDRISRLQGALGAQEDSARVAYIGSSKGGSSSDEALGALDRAEASLTKLAARCTNGVTKSR